MSTSIIDDQDLSRVQYTGSWVRGGTVHEHGGTVASSTVVGDSFTVVFTGSTIGVYGTLDATSAGVVTSYSIDGAPATQVASRGGSGDTYNQQFWQSPTLTTAEHKLVVKMVQVNANSGPGEGTVWFDYFQVATVPTPTTSNNQVATAGTADLAGSATSTPSAAPSPVPSSAPSNKSTNLAAIVGGIVGGLLVLIGIFAVLFVLRRRRRQQPVPIPSKSKKEIDSNFSHPPDNRPLLATYGIDPFMASTPSSPGFPINIRPPVTPSTPNIAPSNYNSSAGQPESFYRNQAQNPSLSTLSHQPVPASSASSYPATSYAPSTAPSIGRTNNQSDSKGPRGLTLAWMPEPEPIQHVDSGVRIDPATKPLELPPVYSAQ